MNDKERIDYLTIMVAKLIQLNIHERRMTGHFGISEVFQHLLEMQESIHSEDCVKSAQREIRI